MQVAIATLNCAARQQRAKDIQLIIEAAIAPGPPDLLAFGAQEIAPVRETLLGNIEAYTAPLYAGTESALARAGPQYRLLASQWAGGVGLVVYARVPAEATTAATSFGNFWSSAKAAAAARVVVGGASYTFVSAHLPAHEGAHYAEQRNAAYRIIANGLRFGEHALYDTGHLFVFGDLNYRAGAGAGADADTDADELTAARLEGKTMWGLKEAPLEFRPTFKYHLHSQEFNTKRSPAWTDRVLYSAASVRHYGSLQDYTASDHRPVLFSALLEPGQEMDAVAVPPAATLPRNLSWALDRALGGGMYLGTTRVGWAILGMVLVALFLL